MVPGEALLATAVVMALEEEMQLLGVGYVRVAPCMFSTPWLDVCAWELASGGGKVVMVLEGRSHLALNSKMNTAVLCDALETIETGVRCWLYKALGSQ